MIIKIQSTYFQCVLLSMLAFVNAACSPKPQVQERLESLSRPLGWTSDYEHIFTKAQTDSLNFIMASFEAETTNEIAVVTIDSNSVIKEEFDSLIIALGNRWRVGKKGKNNGIVIGLSKGHRRIRISNGYGIETKLSDEETKRIIDSTILPYFKKDDYFEGVRQGLLAIMQQLAQPVAKRICLYPKYSSSDDITLADLKIGEAICFEDAETLRIFNSAKTAILKFTISHGGGYIGTFTDKQNKVHLIRVISTNGVILDDTNNKTYTIEDDDMQAKWYKLVEAAMLRSRLKNNAHSKQFE